MDLRRILFICGSWFLCKIIHLFQEYAQQHHAVELKETWYEKLQRWEDALEAYERKQLEDPVSVDLMLGRMRCLRYGRNWQVNMALRYICRSYRRLCSAFFIIVRALGEWERLSQLSSVVWSHEEMGARREVGYI